MNAVVDRIVQFANRYKLTDVATGNVLGTFDFDEVTGTVAQVGTEINAELFDSIADDLATRLKASGGDSKAVVVTFTEAATLGNIASGETHASLFGKIKKWFTERISRLKAYAYDEDTKIGADDVDSATVATVSRLADGTIVPKKATSADTASKAVADKNGKDITTYVATETDPTVPAWAKAATKPSYTKAEVGLGNVDNTADADKPVSTAQQTALSKKVDKVDSKGLSTNDYTTAEKNKLAGLPTDSVRYGSQTLTEAQKSQARSNIGAGTSSFSGAWSDLSGKPNILQSTGTSTADTMSQDAITKSLAGLTPSKHGSNQLTNQDLNDISGAKFVGWYYAGGGNSCANKPSGVNAFGLELIQTASGYFMQILSSADENANRRYVRTSGSTWTAWAKLAETDEIPTSIDGLGGGELTSPLTASGGDGATAHKIILDHSRSGQITDEATSTLVGFLTNNTSEFSLGGSSYEINLRGKNARPTYKGSDLALKSDSDAKYTKPSGGIPKSDLASAVQTSLGKADTAFQGSMRLDGTTLYITL